VVEIQQIDIESKIHASVETPNAHSDGFPEHRWNDHCGNGGADIHDLDNEFESRSDGVDLHGLKNEFDFQSDGVDIHGLKNEFDFRSDGVDITV
jgi:hypothetical protein